MTKPGHVTFVFVTLASTASEVVSNSPFWHLKTICYLTLFDFLGTHLKIFRNWTLCQKRIWWDVSLSLWTLCYSKKRSKSKDSVTFLNVQTWLWVIPQCGLHLVPLKFSNNVRKVFQSDAKKLVSSTYPGTVFENQSKTFFQLYVYLLTCWSKVNNQLIQK